MPILYPFEKRTSAKTEDTEKTVTIALATGKGVILKAYMFDKDFTERTKAYPGQEIGIYVSIQNQGADADYLWHTIKDKDTGAIIVRTDGITAEAYDIFIGAGKIWGTTHDWFVMPNRDWNLLVEAGHGRA